MKVQVTVARRVDSLVSKPEKWEAKLEKIASFSDGDEKRGTATITVSASEESEAKR